MTDIQRRPWTGEGPITAGPGRIVVPERVEPVRWTVEQGRFLLRAEDTGGLFSLIEFTTAPGGGPPPHVHDADDETFYVLDGEYDVRLGDEITRAEPGMVVYGPRGLAHGFRNAGATPARMLCFATPGGAERMFEGLAGILSRPGPKDRSAIEDLVAAHGVTYLTEGVR